MMAEAYANSALLVRILERTEEPEIRAVADEAARVSLKQKNLSALDDVPRDYGGRDARHAVNRILNALNDLGLVNEGGH